MQIKHTAYFYLPLMFRSSKTIFYM